MDPRSAKPNTYSCWEHEGSDVPICGAEGPSFYGRAQEERKQNGSRVPSEVELTIFEGAQAKPHCLYSLKYLVTLCLLRGAREDDSPGKSGSHELSQRPFEVAAYTRCVAHDVRRGPPPDFPPGAGQSQSQPSKAPTSADRPDLFQNRECSVSQCEEPTSQDISFGCWLRLPNSTRSHVCRLAETRHRWPGAAFPRRPHCPHRECQHLVGKWP